MTTGSSTESGSAKILVVDDDRLVLDLTRRTLEAAGYRVLAARDGAEAIEVMRTQRPALVLLDISMPNMDGMEALRRIKNDPELATTHVVIISASQTDAESMVRGLQTGADGYLARPISNRELVARVQAMLRLKAAEDALRRKEKLLHDLIASNMDGMLVVSPAGQVLFANPAACALLGCNQTAIEGQQIGIPLAVSDHTDLDLLRPDGGRRIVELRVKEIKWQDQPALLVALRDMTERKEIEARLEYLANHDQLTGLHNRVYFLDRLNQAIARARSPVAAEQGQATAAVMFLDLDNFKEINDTLGHAQGDVLVCAVAEQLRTLTGPHRIIARIGGDEFTLIADDNPDRAASADIASQILSIFSQPFTLAGQLYQVTTSIGISLYPSDGHDAETLLKCADIAMYRAKQIGNTFEFFGGE